MRYFIEIAYNGAQYCGWQIQPNASTVQEVLQKKLSILVQRDIKVVGAGRTDTGVHAKQLFAHFDIDEIKNTSELIFRLNSFLPNDISVVNLFQVKDDAHARFDATQRAYQYVISLKKNPFLEGLAFQIHNKPDVKLMNEAAKTLLNYNNFKCFSRSKTDVKTYNCTIEKAYWKEEENQLIFTISADRFLRNMVRAIVGTLLDVGYHKTSIEEWHQIIQTKDRSKAGASAPAHGLYLTRVHYPETIKY
ncbi:tRNA pseudouridine(38-40) synthase TruA [Marixanthomonas sp. SCSIO 43207]|uniref:tRNA pseudouridine(38-40) synthase TruA n=1 Tax=Marixanthomonas sp. SCSIO 43207 TaxID=2779360 RepID=UPI001CA7C221|nr:tRNA pseudouridine(38-40) synthase TruA [Marixanthomonas sp. SCSIO 43207]UAB81341.1 tRNA pseudouridine(38-40) synthase TruA [Marixanthomonas sp. SCSIO 43207]